jgi:hypothetical protein
MRLGLSVVCAAVLAAWSAGVAGAFSGGRDVTCASEPTRTFVVRPSDIPAGATTSLLLSCREPSLLGFEGSFGPTGLVIYSQTALRELHDVRGFFTPKSGRSRVGLPVRARYYAIIGPDEISLTVPPTLPAGVYVVVIDDGKADVRAQNLLDVP